MLDKNALCAPVVVMSSWEVSRCDVPVAFVQLWTKASLAAIGWWTLFVFSPQPLVLVPVDTLCVHPAPTDSLMAASLFAFTTGIDVLWHWRGDWKDSAHHFGAMAGMAVCLSCGALGHLVLCATLVLETTGPLYQLLKLRSQSQWLKMHSNELRLLVLCSNLCVRFAYFLWLFLSVAGHVHSKWLAGSTATTSEVCVAAVCVVNCIAGSYLDLCWSQRVLHSFKPSAAATSSNPEPHVVAGVSAIVCFGSAAVIKQSLLPALVVVNSVHYHLIAPYHGTAFAIDILYNSCMMAYFVVAQPSVQLIVCVAISVSGWYTGTLIRRVLPIHAEWWHCATCHVPATIGIISLVDL